MILKRDGQNHFADALSDRFLVFHASPKGACLLCSNHSARRTARIVKIGLQTAFAATFMISRVG